MIFITLTSNNKIMFNVMEKITKEQFEAYEEVRLSGVTNMLDTRRVSRLSNLGLMTINIIMKNYGKLEEKFKN